MMTNQHHQHAIRDGRSWYLLASLCLALLAGSLSADDKSPKPNRKLLKNDKITAVGPEHEAKAIAFVQANHPELLDVLKPLKTMRNEAYQKAIRELYQTSVLLEEMKKRDETRYLFARDAWQLKSRADLMAARLRTAPSESQSEELRRLLELQVELQIRQQEFERERLLARIKRIEANLSHLNENRERTVDRQMNRLVGSPKSEKPMKPEKSSDRKPAPGPTRPADLAPPAGRPEKETRGS